MRITLLLLGKTEEKYLKEGIDIFEKRLRHYIPFQLKVVPAIKNARSLSVDQQKQAEGELLLANFKDADKIVLLDERGKEYRSVEFAGFLQKKLNKGTRHLMFVVGGPYGFSEQVLQAAHEKIALSRLTFSHQMVRLIFTEQLYRAMTILRNEPYHHE